MTVSNQNATSGPYSGNGVTTTFDRTFRIVDASHLVVTQTVGGVTTTLTSGYSQTGVGSDTGTVVFSTAPASGAIITFYREVPLAQESDYTNEGKVPPEVVESDLDLVVMMVQDTDAKIGSMIRLPVGETSTTLPYSVARRGKILGFDETTGEPTLFDDTTGAVFRTLLSSNIAYYVRTDGSDSNSGLSNSSSGAFATLQQAWDTIAALDLNGYTATVWIGDGTHTAGVKIAGLPEGIARDVDAAPIIFRSISADPTAAIVSTTSESCFELTDGAIIEVRDLELRTTTGGNCLNALSGSTLYYRNIRFGACAGFHKQCRYGARMFNGSNYAGGRDFAVVGSATLGHEHVTHGATIINSNATVTLTGTPDFGAYFVGVSDAQSDWGTGMVISGAGTGPRYTALRNGVVRVPTGGGLDFFPGDEAGTAASGGVYLIGAVDAGPYPLALASSGVRVEHTGDTDETTLATFSVPAGSMGTNGFVRVTALFSHTENANTKSMRIRWGAGATTVASASVAAGKVTKVVAEIWNRGSASSQVAGPANFPDTYGNTTADLVTASEDTESGARTIVIAGQLADGADTIALEAWFAEVAYR